MKLNLAIGSFFSNTHCKRLMQGAMDEIVRQRERNRNWDVEVSQFHDYKRMMQISHWTQFDAAIVYANLYEVYHGLPHKGFPAFSSLGIPWINTSNRHAPIEGSSNAPRVIQDDFAIGRLAGEFLRKKGCRHFVFVGFPPDFIYSAQRREGFIVGAGISLQQLHECPDGYFGANSKDEAMMTTFPQWIASLPAGSGIFATNDESADQILRAAKVAEVNIPGDIILLGVDNDPQYSHRSRVSLSSIDPDSYAVGVVAARTLLDWVFHSKIPRQETLVSTGSVVERTSSDQAAVNHAGIARLLRRMREQPEELLDIAGMAAYARLGRRTFHDKFLELVGEQPQQYQLRLRLEAAMKLLRHSDKTVSQIAVQAGFNDEKWFYKAFTRHVGDPPAKYRKTFGSAQ
jgi:LacI family transcriptional regulator